MIFSISFLYSNELMVAPTQTIPSSPSRHQFQCTVTAVGIYLFYYDTLRDVCLFPYPGIIWM